VGKRGSDMIRGLKVVEWIARNVICRFIFRSNKEFTKKYQFFFEKCTKF
jgi:hypothetical protein